MNAKPTMLDFWVLFGFVLVLKYARGLARYSLISFGPWSKIGACYVICNPDSLAPAFHIRRFFLCHTRPRDSTGVTKTFKQNSYIFQHFFTIFLSHEIKVANSQTLVNRSIFTNFS